MLLVLQLDKFPQAVTNGNFSYLEWIFKWKEAYFQFSSLALEVIYKYFLIWGKKHIFATECIINNNS